MLSVRDQDREATARPSREAVDAALVDPGRRERLVRLCARLAPDRTLAEDLAQESLLEGWRHRDRVTDLDGVDRWLSAIARNVCLRSSRRVGRETALLRALTATFADDLSADDPHQAIERDALSRVVSRALADLPQPARDLLRRRHGEELPVAAIAKQLGMSTDAASMRLTRARALLRRQIEQVHREEVAAYGLVPDAAGAWQPTRVWCTQCGARTLSLRRRHDPAELAFRCPACDLPGEPGCVLPLGNPGFAALVGSLSRPASILTRLRAWTDAYYRQGIERGGVACTACRAPVSLWQYTRAEAPLRSAHRVGLAARCPSCATEVSASVQSLALSLPSGRDFLRRHRRVRTARVDWLTGPTGPQVALVFVRHGGNEHLRVVMESASLRVTEVTGTATRV